MTSISRLAEKANLGHLDVERDEREDGSIRFNVYSENLGHEIATFDQDDFDNDIGRTKAAAQLLAQAVNRPGANNCGWFSTLTGQRVFVNLPRFADINIEDIAGVLAKICRFNGHCTEFYSVAQHSVYAACAVADMDMPASVQLSALMHDSAEAYVQDIISPLKMALPEYKEIEIKWEAAIAAKFNLQRTDAVRSLIKAVDLRLLATEHRDLVKDGRNWPIVSGYPPFDFTIEPWSWEEARTAFIHTYSVLCSDIGLPPSGGVG